MASDVSTQYLKSIATSAKLFWLTMRSRMRSLSSTLPSAAHCAAAPAAPACWSGLPLALPAATVELALPLVLVLAASGGDAALTAATAAAAAAAEVVDAARLAAPGRCFEVSSCRWRSKSRLYSS
jgi:hypothetical protein